MQFKPFRFNSRVCSEDPLLLERWNEIVTFLQHYFQKKADNLQITFCLYFVMEEIMLETHYTKSNFWRSITVHVCILKCNVKLHLNRFWQWSCFSSTGILPSTIFILYPSRVLLTHVFLFVLPLKHRNKKTRYRATKTSKQQMRRWHKDWTCFHFDTRVYQPFRNASKCGTKITIYI